jgi:hypothetical protein
MADYIHSKPQPSFEPEAEPVNDFARRVGVGRSIIYRTMSDDPAYRGMLPYLPSLKIGRARRIRLVTGRDWLHKLEAQTSTETV